jgi:hypothetical protein
MNVDDLLDLPITIFKVVGCNCCSSTPNTYRLGISGTTDNGCTNCISLRGTFDLTYVASSAPNCQWNSSLLSNVCDKPVQMQLTCDGTDWIVNIINTTGSIILATYKLAVASFNCLGSSVLNKVFQLANTCNFPSTITITALAPFLVESVQKEAYYEWNAGEKRWSPIMVNDTAPPDWLPPGEFDGQILSVPRD